MPYTPAQLYALVADVERYPDFLPWCLGAQVMRQDDTSAKAILRIGYREFQDSFVSLVRFNPPYAIHVDYGGGPLKTLETDWAFHPTEGGGCTVDFSISFSFKSLLAGAVMDMLFDKVLKKMAQAFEERAHALYGSPC